MRIFFLLCLWALAAAPSAHADIVFKSHGKVVKTASVTELSALVSPRDIVIWEPHEKKEVTFKAFPADELLTKVYGEDWRKSEEALFTCSDGYQPSLPVSEFSAHKGYLAFARADDADFSVMSPDTHEKVSVGPLFLVWENINDASIRKQGTEPGWPYQVTTVDLIRFVDRFPRLTPPAGSSVDAQRGFLQFRKRCLSCHTINGDGGAKGVELNYPANPTEYWNADWLKKWITDPHTVRYNSEMHAFHQDGAGWEKDRDAVIAYLKAMATKKQRPANAPSPKD
jgi:mono/diheme cytochrome c family protein